MRAEQLLLRTAFACIACDGEINHEEVAAIEQLVNAERLANPETIKDELNTMVQQINEKGGAFIQEFLDDVSKTSLSTAEELKLIEVAIKVIEADEKIEYREIKFFKLIRSLLSVSDADILAQFPDKGDYLEQDIVENKWSNYFESFEIPKFAEIN